MNKNCTNCKYFQSWANVCDDELEYFDACRCNNELNNEEDGNSIFVDYEFVCNKHENELIIKN